MQSQVGLPLVFQYNTNTSSTTQNHSSNSVSLFGNSGGQKSSSYFTSNGAQQQSPYYADSSFTSLSSSVKVQPPLGSYSSISMSNSSSSALASSTTHAFTNDGNRNHSVMMNPTENYQQSMQKGYESFR